MAAKDITNETPTLTDAAAAELAMLRGKVEALLNERVAPAVNGVAERATEAAAEARDALRAQADGVATRVREQPFVAIAAATVVGVAIGALLRR